MSAAEALGKKYGPLPAGAWLVAIGGGLVVAVVVRRRAQANASSPAALDATNLPSDNTDTAAGAGNLATSSSGTTTATAPDNDTWRLGVERSLLGQFDPLLVDSALTKYLEGQTLTASDQLVIRAALLLAGPPPIAPPPPLPGVVTVTPAPPVTTPRPVAHPAPTGTFHHGPAPTKSAHQLHVEHLAHERQVAAQKKKKHR